MEETDKLGCWVRFKIWFKNVKFKSSCSNCTIDKSETHINVDIDGDGKADVRIPLK